MPVDARVADAFAAEEDRGLVLATRVRLAAVAVIAAWTLVENRFPGGTYYFWIAVLFGVTGAAPLVLRRLGVAGRWPRYVFPVLDVALFTAAVLIPNPFDPEPVPPAMRLRFGNELYLFLFLLMSLFTYAPGVVLCTGVAALVAWSAGTFWILSRPGSFAVTSPGVFEAMSRDQGLRTLLDPQFVNLGMLGRQVLLLLVFAAGLAVVVRRSRRLVERQVEAERARGNLARYFSPNRVQELAGSDTPLAETREQAVAVLFVDLVGFTAWSAGATPEHVIRLLRDFHARMVAAVFAHDGTVDKYLGDGLMVTFGTPRPGPRDASNALACARAMLAAVAIWNGERATAGEPPLGIGIGVHHGTVVLGDVGDQRHLEFAVVGDTVNVASRLQELTRTLDVALVASAAAVDAARRESGDAAVDGLVACRPQPIRGHREPLAVWTLAAAQTPPRAGVS
jgi:adenylate cyclase